jgi:hypothetical protein
MASEGGDVSEKMMDWVIDELRWKAENFKVWNPANVLSLQANIYQETGMVNVYNGDVVKSDTAIPQSIKDSLRIAVQKLENIPENRKDYHPGSDGKVLDLVHPSLFPLVYGRSRILEDRIIGLTECIRSSGSGKVIEVRPPSETTLGEESSGYRNRTSQASPYSRKFQWLPCDVDISQPSGAKYMDSIMLNEKDANKSQDH